MIQLPDAPAWFARAACASTPDVDFFPDTRSVGGLDLERQAKAVCARCPVRSDCLAYALKFPGISDYGVWGGQSVKDRTRLRRAQRRL